jgi:two-component system sensor kinase FixL
MLKKESPKPESLSINEVVGEVLALLRGEAVIRGVTLDRRLAEDLPRVTGDRVQLQQVLVNLVTNAFDAMRETSQGDRTLAVVTGRDAAGAVQVSVRDRGTGFAGPIEDSFSPFLTTKSHVLGMGLSIARSLVESFGGRMWAENNADGGATVHFTVPVDTSTG